MEKNNLFLIKRTTDDTYILRKDDKYYLGLNDDDLSSLGLNGIDTVFHGIMEENGEKIKLYSATVDIATLPDKYSLIKKDEILKLPLRPGDKFYIKHILENHKNVDLVVIYRNEKLMTAYDKGKVNYVKAFFAHLHTINTHRRLVRHGCFRVGLIRQGLSHDLSKYSPTEFLVGVKYYQGTRSPNVAERMNKGYSEAWLHHKGRNRHHQEYWTDYSIETGELLSFKQMPRKYFVESIMDRIAACKVYRGKDYTDSAPLEYLTTRDSEGHMNKKDFDEMVRIFTMLSQKGEKETFKYLKNEYLK